MKLNKHFLIFASLLISLIVLTGIVIYKYFPLLVHHTIYYCQAVAQALSFQLPKNLGIFIFIIILSVIIFTAIKFFTTLFRIYQFRRYLQKNISKHMSFLPFLNELKLANKVITIKSEKPFAFCFGIKSPKIYISTKLIHLSTRSELKTILLHEQYHLKHRDALTLMIANIIESLFPFLSVPYLF